MNHGAESLKSFKELDEAWAVPKGTAFRAFKRSLPVLVEQQDYIRLDARQHHTEIEALRAVGRVYASSVNVV
ncbi:MAG: hypothetical protein ACRESO_06090, partial [Gammaproteobacteria bacterium]